jgi:tRNA uridine 5-carboxymethylaminomethyl modification enzyme
MYGTYVRRQAAEAAQTRREDELQLPSETDYRAIGGLSAELREKLSNTRPTSLGAASRIPGMTPAALVALLARARKQPPPASVSRET